MYHLFRQQMIERAFAVHLTRKNVWNSRFLFNDEKCCGCSLPRWPSGPKRDCYARGLGFDSQVEQKVLLGFSMKFSVAARS